MTFPPRPERDVGWPTSSTRTWSRQLWPNTSATASVGCRTRPAMIVSASVRENTSSRIPNWTNGDAVVTAVPPRAHRPAGDADQPDVDRGPRPVAVHRDGGLGQSTTSAEYSAPTPARPPPRSTTTTTPTPPSWPPLSPSAPPATPASASPTPAGSTPRHELNRT